MNFLDYFIIFLGFLLNFLIFFIFLYKFFHRPRNIKYLITFVEAETGQGKTSLSIALAKCWHKNYEPMVREQFASEYMALKENGYPEVEMPKGTLCHSDTTAFLSLDKNGEGIEPFQDCDFSKFDIPTEDNYKKIDYYPLFFCAFSTLLYVPDFSLRHIQRALSPLLSSQPDTATPSLTSNLASALMLIPPIPSIYIILQSHILLNI